MSDPTERTMLSPPVKNTNFDDEKISLPENEKEGFSFRKLWAFTGPGFMMSIAYLDPGNIETDLESGTATEYKLLWVLLLATVVGLFIQRLAARLGVVTGMDLAEMCYRQYRAIPRIILWLMTELAIIASDMQEVIGTSIAFYLLSNKGIPLWGGVIIAVINTCMLMLLDIYGLRKLEFLFGFLIFLMTVTFGYEYRVVEPDQGLVLKGMFVPWCKNCDSSVFLTAIEILGSFVMPHNLHLHSALVKSRDVDRRKPERIKEANWYFFIETCIALFIGFIINAFVVAIFAKGLFNKTNNMVRDHCIARNITHYDVFPEDDEVVIGDIYKGGVFLGCYFGTVAMYIWAVGILAAGQSSSMTGTYAGQFAMEGFLNLQCSGWKRTLLTRTITIVPTFFVAFFSHINNLTHMNMHLSAMMSLQLPFALIPTVAFTSNADIMGEFKNGIAIIIISIILSAGLIFINMYLVVEFTRIDLNTYSWFVFMELFSLFYLIMCAYLILHMVVNIGGTRLNNSGFISKFIDGPVPTDFGLSSK